MNITLRWGASLIVIGLGTILSAPSALGQVAFVSKPTLTTGSAPLGVAVGDFKNNQDVGVAVTSGGGGTPIVTVFQGNGDGTFGQSSSYPTGASPGGIAVGDFKNRGAVDLAIANQSSDSITILLNTGTGSGLFTAGTTITLPAGSAPTGIAVGDFDGDHNQDLAVTSYNNNQIFVFLGNGDGTFQGPRTFAAHVGPNPTGIVVADFNRDGADDIAVINSGSFTVTVLLGDGSGMGFAATSYDSYSPHGLPHANGLAVGDFNRDGYPDLAVAFSSVNFATVLLNQGNGTFKAPVAYATSGAPGAIAVGDIDHNGKLALIVPCSGIPATLSVFQGIGDGTFKPRVTVSNPTNSSTGIAIGPFTGSKHVDMAVADSPNLAAIFVDDIVFADGFQ